MVSFQLTILLRNSLHRKELKADFFKKDGDLSESSFKNYKKRMASYIQGLTNASERLNDVQREEACEDDNGDSTC